MATRPKSQKAFKSLVATISICVLCSFAGVSAQNKISVVRPAHTSDINGDTTITISAPGLTSVTPHCWKPDESDGHDSVFATITPDGSGNGSFHFPGSIFPHGPICIKLYGSNESALDTFYLQLFNTGGVSWNEGLPPAPPQAAGMTLNWADDFTGALSISSSGENATYGCHAPGGDFSGVPFRDFDSPQNPFLQRETYLRIRADLQQNSTGLLHTRYSQGINYGYFECRFIAPSVDGSWPAFWLLTDRTHPEASGSDEIDVIEAYGMWTDQFHGGWHIWSDEHTSEGSVIPMPVAESGGWAETFHTYGVLVTPESMSWYLDNVKVMEMSPTTPNCAVAPLFPLVNLAIGGASGWPYTEFSRYNIADMYVDYIRMYEMDYLKPPTMSPPGGIHSSPVLVTLSSETDVVIHYTTNGLTPTESSPLYTEPILVEADRELKAIGIRGGSSSGVRTEEYIIAACGDGWCSSERGTPSPAGSFAVDGDTVTVRGGSDRFFVYRQLVGDFTFTARVSAVNGSMDNGRTAGLLVRANLTEDAGYPSMAVVLRKLDGGFEFSALGDGSDMAYNGGAGWDENRQYLRISRLGDIFTLQTGASVDNLASSYLDTLTMPESLYVGFDVGSNVSGTLHSAKFGEVSVVNVGTQCSDDWCSVEQGTPSPAGSFTVNGNALTVNGGQNRLFVYQPITGDFSITARLSAISGSTDDYRTAGLLVRANLSGEAGHPSMAIVMHKLDGGLAFSTSGDGSDLEYTGGAGWDDNHQFLRISRQNDLFTIQSGDSADDMGTTYTKSLVMPDELYVGFVVGSNVSGTLHTATFDNISVGGSDITTNGHRPAGNKPALRGPSAIPVEYFNLCGQRLDVRRDKTTFYADGIIIVRIKQAPGSERVELLNNMQSKRVKNR